MAKTTDKDRVLAEVHKRIAAGQPVRPASIAKTLRLPGPEYDRGAPVRRMLAELESVGALVRPSAGHWLPEGAPTAPGVFPVSRTEARAIREQIPRDRRGQNRVGIRVYRDEDGEGHVVVFKPGKRYGKKGGK